MGSRRARMIRATAFFFLLLQAASTHQASVPTDANLVLTAAAESLENVLGLDYNVLEPTFRDIDLVKENLVELMPYLEESERPVITTAYANLLDLEGTLSVDFGTTLGLLTDKATRYSQQMQGKIARYPKKFKSSLRTLNTFLATVSENTNGLAEASDNALRQAKVVLISVEAFKKIRNISSELRTANENIKTNSLSVQHLKENSE